MVQPENPMSSQTTSPTITLAQIAVARSGDKGNHANLGVVAYTRAGYECLERELTVERLGTYFAGLAAREVRRYLLPRILSMNFLLLDALGGGASRSLRIDTQGKLLGTALLELELPRPDNLAEMLAG